MARSTRNYRPRYGFGNFIVDSLMTIITAGFWLIWVFVREIRRQY